MKDHTKCTACRLHQQRRNIVLGEGDVPCDVLFVGEAPGKAEDLRGRPFVGPSGRLLRIAIERACNLQHIKQPRIFITNIVACRPCEERFGPNRAPEPDECIACRPRLVDEVVASRARKVILLGEIAAREACSICPDGVHIYHPSYISRVGGVGSGAFTSFVRNIQEVFRCLGNV